MKHLGMIPLFILLISCQGSAKKTTDNSPANNESNTELIGGVKDKHGCLTSAGYTWSEVQNDCIRLFEAGIRIMPVTKSDSSNTSGFIVLSKDSASAELFLPAISKAIILEKKNNSYTYSNDQYEVKYNNNTWTLKQDGSLVYSSK